MNSIFYTIRAALCRTKKWGDTSNQVSFVEVKELYDSAYAVIDDLKKHNVLIRKANRLQERYITQLQNNQQGLAGVL